MVDIFDPNWILKKMYFFIFLLFFMATLHGCASHQENIDLKPHVNKMALRINELSNQLYDLDTRFISFEKKQAKVPDHLKRIADLENKLKQLEEKIYARSMETKDRKNLWKDINQKLQTIKNELTLQKEGLLKYQKDTQEKLEKLHSFQISLQEKEHLLAAPVPGPADKISDKSAYEEAMQLLKGGNLLQAREKFKTFLIFYPNSDLADNAQFWIGESFFDEKEYERAILEYEKVLQNYPKADKVPSALLKQGFSFHALGKTKEAKILFEQVIQKAPQSEQAQIAKKKLNLI